ncbi:MAG: hypothetical protein CMB78_01635 [Euryarchaeota archaeon]|nr:hypothetical protein [Euryarchaeota archaeon]
MLASSRIDVGRIVVHLDSKPKEKSIASIISDFEDRVRSRGISIHTHGNTKDSGEYESELSRLSGEIVILDPEGDLMSSEQFASWIKSTQLRGETTHFVVGPHEGFSREFKESANSSFSLSRLTMTHEMSAAVLLEQLYRASEINRGSRYHRV